MLATTFPRSVPHYSEPMSTGNDTNALPHHGVKRKTEDELVDEQRFAKRFHLLSLGKKNSITAEDIQKVHQRLANQEDDQNDILGSTMDTAPRLQRSRSNAFSDSMNVDDSRDRIFIHSIEDELADLSSDEERPIFIPDIERRLNMLPKALLRPDGPVRVGNELVLYEVPSSLSIPAERDSTRKAIIESRRRAQEQALHVQSADSLVQTPIKTHAAGFHDEDAMDMS